VQTEYAGYFEALNQHPRTLVGRKVPRLDGKDGDEVLRDAEDARDWQEAAKHQLAAEVRHRASKASEDQAEFMQTVHASIDMFQKNPDMIPGTKGFDKDLADQFATLAAPYELRVEGKLQGYSIPVQPLIDSVRATLAASRAAAAAPAPAAAAPPAGAPAAGAPPAAAGAPPSPEPPQEGITTKAGSGGADSEQFGTLFSTIHPDLANIRI
jgi:hypothetical protein